MVGFWPPPWSQDHWDWSRTSTSLGMAQRYAALSPPQRVLHDVEALLAPPELQRLMPAQTRARIVEAAFHEKIATLRGAL